MRDSPSTVASRFMQITLGQSVVSVKGLSCPSSATVIKVHFPKTDLPYKINDGRICDECVVNYAVVEARVTIKTPIEVFNNLYRGWRGSIENDNVLHKVKTSDSEFYFGNGIIIERDEPLFVCVNLVKPEGVITRRVMVNPVIFKSFSPFYKYILQKLIPVIVERRNDVTITQLISQWIDSYTLHLGHERSEGQLLMDHIDEIHKNCL